MSGDITLSATSTSESDSLFFDTSDLNLQTSRNISIRGENASDSIGLGDSATGTLHLSNDELATIADGASSITFGRSDGSGALDVEVLSFSDSVVFRTDTGSIEIGGSLDLGSNALLIDSNAAFTQSAKIVADSLALSGSGVKTLENAANDIATIAGSGGAISYVDSDGFSIGSVTVGATTLNGISLGGNDLTLSATGSVTQSQDIIVNTLILNGVGGAYLLDRSSNDMDTVSGNTGSIELYDTDAINVGSITATDLTLVSGGALTGSDLITVSDQATFKTLNDAGADITLSNVGNSFGAVTAIVRNVADITAANGDVFV